MSERAAGGPSIYNSHPSPVPVYASFCTERGLYRNSERICFPTPVAGIPDVTIPDPKGGRGCADAGATELGTSPKGPCSCMVHALALKKLASRPMHVLKHNAAWTINFRASDSDNSKP